MAKSKTKKTKKIKKAQPKKKRARKVRIGKNAKGNYFEFGKHTRVYFTPIRGVSNKYLVEQLINKFLKKKNKRNAKAKEEKEQKDKITQYLTDPRFASSGSSAPSINITTRDSQYPPPPPPPPPGKKKKKEEVLLLEHKTDAKTPGESKRTGPSETATTEPILLSSSAAAAYNDLEDEVKRHISETRERTEGYEKARSELLPVIAQNEELIMAQKKIVEEAKAREEEKKREAEEARKKEEEAKALMIEAKRIAEEEMKKFLEDKKENEKEKREIIKQNIEYYNKSAKLYNENKRELDVIDRDLKLAENQYEEIETEKTMIIKNMIKLKDKESSIENQIKNLRRDIDEIETDRYGIIKHVNYKITDLKKDAVNLIDNDDDDGKLADQYLAIYESAIPGVKELRKRKKTQEKIAKDLISGTLKRDPTRHKILLEFLSLNNAGYDQKIEDDIEEYKDSINQEIKQLESNKRKNDDKYDETFSMYSKINKDSLDLKKRIDIMKMRRDTLLKKNVEAKKLMTTYKTRFEYFSPSTPGLLRLTYLGPDGEVKIEDDSKEGKEKGNPPASKIPVLSPKPKKIAVEQPKVDQPQEQPKAERKGVKVIIVPDKPKAEQPKVEQPKVEQPKAEQPKVGKPGSRVTTAKPRIESSEEETEETEEETREETKEEAEERRTRERKWIAESNLRLAEEDRKRREEKQRLKEEKKRGRQSEQPGAGRENGGMYGDEIDLVMKRYPEYAGTIARDEVVSNILPQAHPNKMIGWIMNMDKAGKKGSHWVAVCIIPNQSVNYYNSYAEPMPDDIRKDVKHVVDKMNPNTLMKFKENRIKQQSETSSNCGWFCVKFLMNMFDGKPFVDCTGFSDVMNGEKDIEQFKQDFKPFEWF